MVQALNSGKASDSFVAASLHELWFGAACNESEVRVVHLSSSENRAADLLSPWHLDSRYASHFLSLPILVV